MTAQCAASRWRRPCFVLLAMLCLLVQPSAAARAHELPERVAISIFAHPDGDRLRLLVRVPLEAMRDVEFPLRADGTLDVELMTPLLREAAEVWLRSGIRAFEDGRPLESGAVVAFVLARPADRSFEQYADALEAVTRERESAERVAELAGLRLEQALFDVLLEYPVTRANARFAIEPMLAHLGVRTTTVLRFVMPAGDDRAFHYTGDPGRIELDPSWFHAARTFIALGFTHILSGLDHLLFVFCLVIPVRRWRPLVAIVSAFTVAHSITLATAAFGYTPQALWFAPLVETLIAGSIVYMAIENMVRPAAVLERRWPIAFAFGLVHGFGFSFALQESLQFAGGQLLASLAAFNVGVELGQLLVLAVAVPALALVVARVSNVRVVVVVLSALVAHSAWHWMTERGAELLSYEVSLSAPPLVMWLAVLRLALLLAVASAVAWGLSGVFGRLSGDSAESVPRL